MAAAVVWVSNIFGNTTSNKNTEETLRDRRYGSFETSYHLRCRVTDDHSLNRKKKKKKTKIIDVHRKRGRGANYSRGVHHRHQFLPSSSFFLFLFLSFFLGWLKENEVDGGREKNDENVVLPQMDWKHQPISPCMHLQVKQTFFHVPRFGHNASLSLSRLSLTI